MSTGYLRVAVLGLVGYPNPGGFETRVSKKFLRNFRGHYRGRSGLRRAKVTIRPGLGGRVRPRPMPFMTDTSLTVRDLVCISVGSPRHLGFIPFTAECKGILCIAYKMVGLLG